MSHDRRCPTGHPFPFVECSGLRRRLSRHPAPEREFRPPDDAAHDWGGPPYLNGVEKDLDSMLQSEGSASSADLCGHPLSPSATMPANPRACGGSTRSLRPKTACGFTRPRRRGRNGEVRRKVTLCFMIEDPDRHSQSRRRGDSGSLCPRDAPPGRGGGVLLQRR